MQARPTTQQILTDLAREVRDVLIPAVADPSLAVNLAMMEQLLAACAVRAGHEIAWLAEEEATLVAYAGRVAAVLAEGHADNAAAADAVRATLVAYADGRSDGLHLEERVQNYHLAGEAFSAALAAAFAAEHDDLIKQASAVIHERLSTEEKVRPGFVFPGRT